MHLSFGSSDSTASQFTIILGLGPALNVNEQTESETRIKQASSLSGMNSTETKIPLCLQFRFLCRN